MERGGWNANSDSEGADPGALGDDSVLGGPARHPGAGQDLSARAARHGVLGIDVESDRLLVAGVDISAARDVLVEIGADGRSSVQKLSAEEAIALLSRLSDLSGAIAAVQARALVRLEEGIKEDCRRREESAAQAQRVARSEASRALKQSGSCAGQSMATSRRLVQSMPGMLRALAHGRIVSASAHRVGRTVGPATPEQRARVDEILSAHLPYLEGCGPEEWGGEAEKVLHGLDPHGAADRHRAAKRERSVTVRRGDHGMCTLTARLTGLDGARIRKGLSLAAERSRAHGDRRGHQQIMADLLADALIGRGEGIDPTTLDIGVIITDRSLLAPDHADAATIEGYGAVPYEHIREEMRGALESAEEDPELAMTLRRLYTDVEDGQLVAVESSARSFPPSLARFLRLAHQTCRAPYCDASIRQNDHIVPWSQGGSTSLDNGNGLCAGDNQKDLAGETVRVVRDEDGIRRTVEWTTRYGQKARRRGTNFDPLGTGARLLGREALAAERDATAGQPDPGPPAHGSASGSELGTPMPHREPGDVTCRDGSDGPLHQALALLEPEPRTPSAEEDRHRRLHRRKDHVFLPHLTLLSETPWHGPGRIAA